MKTMDNERTSQRVAALRRRAAEVENISDAEVARREAERAELLAAVAVQDDEVPAAVSAEKDPHVEALKKPSSPAPDPSVASGIAAHVKSESTRATEDDAARFEKFKTEVLAPMRAQIEAVPAACEPVIRENEPLYAPLRAVNWTDFQRRQGRSAPIYKRVGEIINLLSEIERKADYVRRKHDDLIARIDGANPARVAGDKFWLGELRFEVKHFTVDHARALAQDYSKLRRAAEWLKETLDRAARVAGEVVEPSEDAVATAATRADSIAQARADITPLPARPDDKRPFPGRVKDASPFA